MGKFYDGTKLLSMTDLNGEKPELFICTSNRSAGKTTYFSRLCVNRFKDKGEKFGLLYRYNYEIDECVDKFFKDIQRLFFNDDEMTSKPKGNGVFHELYLNGVSCGYAFSLNNADQIKKYSHLFSDISRILFDEFQSETNRYCSNEIKKFISIHTSIARGNGEQVRYVPVYMLSNPVTMLNPYYISMGITTRLNDKVRFLRGDGYVLEQGYNESAAELQKNTGFNRAFASDSYVAYASEGVYLNDNLAFVEKPSGMGRYIVTLRYNGTDFAIKEYADKGFLYCDDKPDNTFRYKITVTTEDHQVNYVILKQNDLFLSNLRYYFSKGCFRFKDLRCKEAVLKALSY